MMKWNISYSQLGTGQALCLLIGAMATLVSNRSFAQASLEPERLLTDGAIFLLDIHDLPEVIGRAKAGWYDSCYGTSIEDGLLKPLDIPTPQRMFGSHEHWLSHAFSDSTSAEESVLADIRQKVVALCEHPKDLDREKVVISGLANLFAGRAFIALDGGARARTVFAFEFDPNRFDWRDFLGRFASGQGGDGEAVGKAGEIDIFVLPKEGLYYFSADQILYGVFDRDVEFCLALANRVSDKGKTRTGDALENSRRYQRVMAAMPTGRQTPEVFCYARIDDMFEQFNSNKILSAGKIVSDQGAGTSNSKHIGWSAAFGASLWFDVNKNSYEYCAVYPLEFPLPKHVRESLEALGTIEAKKDRYIVPGASWCAYLGKVDSVKIPNYQVSRVLPGYELSISNIMHLSMLEKDITENKPENRAETFSNTLSNALFQKEGGSEVCKFVTLLLKKDAKYFDPEDLEVDFMRGAYVQANPRDEPTRESILESIRPWINSPFVSDFDQALSSRDGVKSDPSTFKPTDKGDSFREFDSIRHGTRRIYSYGRESPLFSVIEMDSGVALVSKFGVKGELLGDRVISSLSGDFDARFKLDDVLEWQFDRIGALKGIKIRRNFSSLPIEHVAFQPLFDAFREIERSAPFSLSKDAIIMGDNAMFVREVDDRMEWSPLTRLLQAPLSIFSSKTQEVTHLNILPAGNSAWIGIDAMFLSNDLDAIKYLGCLRKFPQ